MNCEFCQSPVHIWFQCPKKPDGWKPARLATKSTAARKDVQTKAKGGSFVHKGEAQSDSNSVAQSGERLPDGRRSVVRAHPTAGTQDLPVDTPKRGRPPTGFDKRAYNTQYMADRRAGKR